MNRAWICIFLSLPFLASIGCSPAQRSPDAIREDTAKATVAAARDAKAVVQGVVEGLKTKGPININKASEDDIASLPDITSAQAQRIVAGRPYANSSELVKRHLISKTQYDHIASKVTTR